MKIESLESEYIKINRKDINLATYNPRKIKDSIKSKLNKKLKQKGLLMPLVWNKRTKTLVSGHQRIEQIDKIKKSQDYTLTVSCVDLDLKDEIELNIILNNPSAMGEFDQEKLIGIKEQFDIDFINDAGFDFQDIQFIEINNDVQIENRPEKGNYQESALSQESRVQKPPIIDDTDTLITFVFLTNKDKRGFMEKIGQGLNVRRLNADVLYDLPNYKNELFS